jgi:ACT domain-containing protein
MKAIVTVVGTDKVGIIAAVSSCLAELQVNILDIRQTTMQEYFTMMMLVDTAACTVDTATLQSTLAELGKSIGEDIRLQHEDIFHSMHRV